MNKKYIFYILYFINLGFCWGQSLQYTPLRCRGEIPNDFLELSSTKINKELSKLGNENAKNKKYKKEFLISSNFSIDDILFSGKILYGDVLTQYVNKVADVILSDDLELRKKLRFYVIKSAQVNAYSTNQGIVFITVGLLSQIESEAQLAYILCHEIAHYTEKHNLESYITNREIMSGKGDYKKLDLDERVNEVFNYSKENELDADKLGYKRYKKTKYSNEEIINGFDMLFYSYLPWNEIDWNLKELQDSNFIFPTSNFKFKKSEISSEEDENDEENSSHPNIKKRKEELNFLIEVDNDIDSLLYIVGEDEFNIVQQQARIELFFILLNQAQYEKAYYCSYIYKKVYQDSIFSETIANYALYSISSIKSTFKYTGNDKMKVVKYKKKNISEDEGAYFKVKQFFKKISAKEMSVVAVRQSWQTFSKNKNNEFLKSIFISSVYNLVAKNDLDINNFKIDNKKSIKKDFNKKTNSKVSNIKKKKYSSSKDDDESKVEDELEEEEEEEKNNINYIKSAFKDYLKDNYFYHILDSISNLNIKKSDEDEPEIYRSDYRKIRKHNKRHGNRAGIDSLIFLNPFYSKNQYLNNGNKVDLFKKETEEIKLADLYIEYAKLNEINVEMININKRSEITTKTMNDYAIIVDWLTERLYNEENQELMFNQQFISDFIDEKGSDKLMLSGITYSIEKNEVDPGTLILSILFYPALPFYLIYIMSLDKTLEYTTIIYNLKNGKIEYLNADEFKISYKKDYVKSHIYSLFHQIKSKK